MNSNRRKLKKNAKLSSTGKYRRSVYVSKTIWEQGLEVAKRNDMSLNRLVTVLFKELHSQLTTPMLTAGLKLK